MIALTLLSALAAAPLLAKAAPTDANIALARKYAPQFLFEKNEMHFGSSVEYFLNGPITPKDANGNNINSGALNLGNLNSLPNGGDGVFLSVDVNANKDGFLTGQNPSTTQGAKVYTFVAPKANDVVDLYYWLFTPYNLAKKVPLLGEVGNHVGDWERLKVRTVNGTATAVEYHAHGDTGSGTIPWNEVKKFDNDQRPVGYIASGSHGLWSSAGTFTYVNAVVFKLQDVTSDGGVAWDTKDSLEVLNYPDTFSGDLNWLNYRGRWGNKGVTGCWWSVFYKECELVDAPPGPLRDDILGASFTKVKSSGSKDDMSVSSSHSLATVSTTRSSSYTVYVKDIVAPFVSVRQTCTADSDGNASHLVHHLEQKQDGSFVKRAEPEATFVYGTSPFTPSASGRTTVSVAACPTGTAVTTYSVAACTSSSVYDCDFSTMRPVRAYSSNPAVKGIQAATAITLNDLDLWLF